MPMPPPPSTPEFWRVVFHFNLFDIHLNRMLIILGYNAIFGWSFESFLFEM